jgi:hypothetical protein
LILPQALQVALLIAQLRDTPLLLKQALSLLRVTLAARPFLTILVSTPFLILAPVALLVVCLVGAPVAVLSTGAI